MMEKEAVHNPPDTAATNSLCRKLIWANLALMVAASAVFFTVIIISKSIWITAGAAILTELLSCAVVYAAVRKIVDPVNAIKKRISAMAVSCDYTSAVPFFETNDEVQELCGSVRHLQQVQQCHMAELIRILNSIASNNLNEEIHCAYPGDYNPQKVALQTIIRELNSSLGQINMSTLGIASATEHVSQGVQMISDGAAAQLDALGELSGTISDVYGQARDNAQDATRAGELSRQAGGVIMRATERLHEMLDAMKEIGEASAKISKVIKTVDDIAFQTNILALNASVEAARAGASGKGFAVVAGEVRNLANKSAQASRGTAELIESAIRSVDNGTKIAGETAQAFEKVMIQAKAATELTDGIATAFHEQEIAIQKMSRDVDRISQVVHANTSTAQEGAAASEELSSESQLLKGLTGRFILKRGE